MTQYCSSPSGFSIWTLLSAIIVCFTLVSAQQGPNSIVVSNGFLLHAALTSPQLTRIFVAQDIEFTFDSCPFPAADGLGSTQITRNVTISSLLPISPAGYNRQQQKRITAAAPTVGNPPYQINCNYLAERFEIAGGYQVTLSNLIITKCRTTSAFGFFRKRAKSAVVFDRVVDDRGAVCVPLDQFRDSLMGPEGFDGTTPVPQDQLLERLQPYQQRRQGALLTPAGSNWCNSSSTRSSRDALTGEPLFPLANNISSPLCKEQAVLLYNVSYEEQVINSDGSLGHPYNFTANNSVVLCPDPVSPDCIRDKGSTACLAAAYTERNPDNIAPCAVVDGFSFQDCLQNPAYSRVVLVQQANLNLSTSPATEQPVLIDRDIRIMADPRGPRLELDCGLLSNRFQLAPGRTLTFYHLIISNCTSTKPVSFIRILSGSRVIFNDTFVVQPPGLCTPVDAGHNAPADQQNNTVAVGAIGLGNPRPDGLPGFQQFQATQAGRWCSRDTGLPVNVTFQIDDSSNGWTLTWNKVAVFANETGYGPANAATLPAPAPTPFFVHPTWPGNDLCAKTTGPDPMLMYNYAVNAPYGWQVTANATNPPHNGTKFGSDLDRVNGSYSGTFALVYFNSILLCESVEPLPEVAANCSVPKQGAACQAKVYAAMDPDRQLVPGAAAYEEAQAAGTLRSADGGSGGGGSNHGVKVVLPAVLGSIGGAAIIAAILAAFLINRRKRNQEAAVAHPDKLGDLPISAPGQQQPLSPAGPLAWLGLAKKNPDSSGSSDLAKRLLGIHSTPSSADRTLLGVGNRSRASQHSHMTGPDGIQLGTLLGAGSFGRVYAGTWQGTPVAVKVITHSRADDTRIGQELSLSLSFDHPNLVRALHYVKVDINPQSPDISEGDSDIFLPSGAVGVFTLPEDWAVVQKTQQAAAAAAAKNTPAIDTETWIVMDLMDHGNLAVALRHGNIFVNEKTGALNMARLLRRAADVASGLAYLHSRSVCHGDLKWENVLLKTERQDTDGVMAKIADFGLSRALAFGQSHLSTRRYGTVTHMPPELLVAGKLTPAADVYSFGIMMWELVSRSLPFEGLHHGEVIHRVVTEDLRPGPWPTASQTGLLLPTDYISVAEACWARRTADRPTMADVLQRLINMLAEVERPQEV